MTQYDPRFKRDYFIGRTSEIKRVKQVIQELKKKDHLSSQPKSIAFQGDIGMGKSWLLRYLLGELSQDPDLKVVYLDLKDYSGDDPSMSVLKVMQLFVDNMELNTVGISLAEASKAVIREIKPLLSLKLLVILVDHVYESSWKLLGELENALFGPLAIEPWTFFILAGRGREYPWKTPELRLRAEFIDLKPFTPQETTDQLMRISSTAAQKAPQIFDISHGNPLLNSLLIERSREKLDQAIDYTLETIPQSERRQMRTYLEALSPLRYFDEERIPSMLNAYDPSSKVKEDFAEASRIRDDLVRTAFARWDDDKGGFVMDRYLRGLLTEYLSLYETKKWRQLHGRARTLYEDWKEKYKTARKFWEEEIRYHQSKIEEKKQT